MKPHTKTPLPESGDLKPALRLQRAFLLALCLMVLMYTGACGGDMSGSLVQDYHAAYGTDSRQSSDLLGTTTSLLTDTTSTLTQSLTAEAPQVAASVATENSETAVYLTCSADTLSDARVVLASGDVLSFSLSGTTARLGFPKQDAWTHAVVSTGSGGKWYFDNGGVHLLGGYTPRITVMPGGGIYTFASSDAISDVRLYYSNGNVSGGSPDNRGRVAASSGVVSYMVVGLRYNSGSKWYFDRNGLPLANGYKPTVYMTWKNNSLYIESSDLLDKAVLFYSDYSKDTFSLGSNIAWLKPFRGKTVDGFYVRMKSDGSKWYFDSAGLAVCTGSKWFSDVD